MLQKKAISLPDKFWRAVIYPSFSRSIEHCQKIGVAVYSHFVKLPMKRTFSYISLIPRWWHWCPISQVLFWTCPFSVLSLKYEVECSLARGSSWAELPRRNLWCAYLVLHFSDRVTFSLLCFSWIISNLIMLLFGYSSSFSPVTAFH